MSPRLSKGSAASAEPPGTRPSTTSAPFSLAAKMMPHPHFLMIASLLARIIDDVSPSSRLQSQQLNIEVRVR
eukprot:CAMPEP_0173068556 /NCGR_PEP_ID=MMETSP1102-20130122/7483_1 /TAXON_ID=49646 /ORGANISM="Geminigera sp., Strain Caron Lab Isolate" /LENGTH=71 /DNA_ID=CAMNT_0013936439 /DNA_START=610 /DNA_END=821 /DNA_ORIENTATION=+